MFGIGARGRVLVSWLILASAVWAQERTVVVMPGQYGATPYSAAVHAQAAYVVAQGQFLESQAIARRVHAEAAAKEIENAVAYVDAYFKRREINRAARAKEEPGYQERLKKQLALFEEQLRYRFPNLMKGDVSPHLNWLLRQLEGPTLAEEYLLSGQPLADSTLDAKLDPRETRLVWLTDGGSKGSQLLFRAGEGKVLETNWPPALRGEACDQAREEFELARDEVTRQLARDKDKVASRDSQQRLMKAVNGLLVALQQSYPKDVREDSTAFLQYQAGRRYLQSLLAQVHRAINSDDRTLFERSMQFDGDSVVDLLRYMYRNGMLLAPPQPGGEEVYNKLFLTMRNLYLNIVSEPPPGARK